MSDMNDSHETKQKSKLDPNPKFQKSSYIVDLVLQLEPGEAQLISGLGWELRIKAGAEKNSGKKKDSWHKIK